MITGKEALEIFYNESSQNNEGDLPNSFQEFLNILSNHKNRGYNNLEMTLTNVIEVLDDDSFFGIDDDIEDSMIELARKYKGSLPHPSAFTMAISNEWTSIPQSVSNYFEVVEEIADVTTQVAKDAGSSITKLSDNINWLSGNSKWILLGGSGLAIYFAIKRFVPDTTKLLSKRRK